MGAGMIGKSAKNAHDPETNFGIIQKRPAVGIHPMSALLTRPREIDPVAWWLMEWWRKRLAELAK